MIFQLSRCFEVCVFLLSAIPSHPAEDLRPFTTVLERQLEGETQGRGGEPQPPGCGKACTAALRTGREEVTLRDRVVNPVTCAVGPDQTSPTGWCLGTCWVSAAGGDEAPGAGG